MSKNFIKVKFYDQPGDVIINIDSIYCIMDIPSNSGGYTRVAYSNAYVDVDRSFYDQVKSKLKNGFMEVPAQGANRTLVDVTAIQYFREIPLVDNGPLVSIVPGCGTMGIALNMSLDEALNLLSKGK